MTTRALLVLVLCGALGAWAAPKKAAKARPPKTAKVRGGSLSTGPGEVKYVTADKAFIDRGLADGVAVGQQLKLMRSGKPAGDCTVDSVADHFATCPVGGLRKGDRVAVLRAPEGAPPGPPVALPTEAELARRQRALESAPTELVGTEAEGLGATVRPRFSVAVSQTSYGNLGGPDGPFQQQRVDVGVYDVDVWRGVRVSADLTVLNFSRKPPDARTVYTQTPVLLVRQLEVGFRRADVPFSAALGRTWLRYSPGLLVVDGAQASWRTKGEGVEVGVFGGLLPDATTLVPVTSQGTAGAFFMGRTAVGSGAKETLLQTELRVGYASKQGLGNRLEVAVAGHVYRGSALDLHLTAEVGVGESMAPGAVDAARLDLGWRPTQKLRFIGGARYRGQSPSGVVELGLVSPGQHALHGDLGVVYEATPAVWLGVQGGAATDFTASLTQGRVGPEVTFPTLFGRAGGMSVGYMEELGWMRARHAYVQFSLSGWGRVRVLNRTSWFNQQPSTGSQGLAGNEAGTTLGLDIRFVRWLWLRASVSGRMQLEDPSRTAGLVSVQLGGQY